MEDRSADAKDSKNTAGSSLVQFCRLKSRPRFPILLVLFSAFIEPWQILSYETYIATRESYISKMAKSEVIWIALINSGRGKGPLKRPR